MIRLDSVSKAHGRQILFLEASLSVFAGEKVGLVGPNGAGKSTVFRMLVGAEAPDGGSVVVERGVAIGYFDQSVGEMSGRSVLAETLAGAGEVSAIAAELAQLEAAMSDPARMDELDALVERYGELQGRFETLDGYSLEARALEILAGLGFTADRFHSDVGQLSGGWKMRVALARILLMKPEALLLDEPTNHLDIESILWLEGFLRAFTGALLITSHDREFLNRLVTRIVEIDSGELTSFTGDYSFYERQRELLATQAEAQAARQQAMLAKERAFIERFKARASHAAQVQSRVKKLEKIDVIEPPTRRHVPDFEFRSPPRSGDEVARLAKVSKGYGPRSIYDNLDLLIRRTERWCVMGVNGAGKSTLLKLIVGETTPDAGTVTLGASLKLGYFAQHTMEVLDPDATVMETLESSFPHANTGTLRTLAAAFGFPGDDIQKRCRLLSGGERARLVMARLLFDPPNFLVLDEPTNHLDIATKEMLVRALAAYEGTMLFVSHDRAFLQAVANRVLELGPDGPRVFEGGYRSYVESVGYEAPGVR
ncbi:MAG: ABC-F family ATP-binding cassette domain-containing protein [Myxococcales bacterium]|nr:ABC-F family ATP-binding cassette domain-containing protein [Myxococcales bacterium]MCB9530908.1 ABC-F family ATP-binding cassette domain-containing protein [Myxococcales bacterium]MCB9534561.1 ABC-F family ATP-binding cassette domain-containing protein [Myxococcales bacterium]